MRLAIADPPYLGRGRRWYGDGRGMGNERRYRPDYHPEAAEWDDPGRHRQLVRDLYAEFDGWAIALAPDSLAVYLAACQDDVRVMVWHRRNSPPTGNRIRTSWEPVIIRQPPTRRGRDNDLPTTTDVLDIGADRRGFAGAKPAEWTRWVLAAIGYSPGEDDLVDLFPGSGAVSAAADGMLALKSRDSGS